MPTTNEHNDKYNKQTNNKLTKQKMKKHYTEPAIDLVEMEVEQGIASSLMSGGEFFKFDENSGFDKENINEFGW